MNWWERNFSDVKPGVIVQHSKTMRYGKVLEEPGADTVLTHHGEWKLKDLQHRSIDNKIVTMKPWKTEKVKQSLGVS